VGAARSADSIARTTILVPTARLRDHLQRRLVERRPVWLGVEVLHFRALAYGILEGAGRPRPTLISPRVLEALLGRLLREEPENVWSRFVRARPGALRHLLGSLRDLREAGIRPAEWEACCGEDRPERDALGLYRSYSAALDAMAGEWVDEAGLVQAALPHARRFAAGRNAIFVAGAYEWIGVHLDLLRELDRGRRLTVLLPFEPGKPCSAYAEAFARRHLLDKEAEPEAISPRDASRPAVELASLFDETARPRPAEPGHLSFRHTQGAAAEVRAAVRGALEAVREGCPPAEIVIAARGLEPYAAALEAIFEDEGLPWTSSLATPLRRHPLAHDLMVLLEVLDRDFPRRATAEALRSPRIRWDRVAGGSQGPPGERADRWSRKAAIVGGLDEWTTRLESWAGRVELRDDLDPNRKQEAERRARQRSEQARRIGDALKALHDRVEPGQPRRWDEHARHVESIVREFLQPDDDGSRSAVEALQGLLDEMRTLVSVAGESRPVSFATMVAWLEAAVDGAGLALRRPDGGGIRVLDAMQFRGLTCRRLFLMGMNAGQLPRIPREDPVLPDELRRRLVERTGRPLPVKSEGADEERLILALLLGAAEERIDLSWQRADESGRARTPSLALRELARLARGRPDLAGLVEEAAHLPSHPEHRLAELDRQPGLLAPDEERLMTVLRSRGPMAALDRWYGDLEPGLRMLRATEGFRRGSGAYDGRVGELRCPPSVLSVTALRTLGRCPLQFFFARILRVRELDEEVGAFDLAAEELGQSAHDLLEAVYTALREEQRFDGDESALSGRRGVELLEALWPRAVSDLERRLGTRAPVLWQQLRRNWLESLTAFLAEDLERIATEGWGAPLTERSLEADVDLGDGLRVRVRGRLDRSFETTGGTVVGDYKTGSLKNLDDIKEMLRGNELQVPLYWLLARPAPRVEILGVGPRHDPRHEEPAGRRLLFEGFESDRQRQGFLETMRTLAALIDRGCFPLRPNDDCRWCVYGLACRKNHPPTLEREDQAEDSADFRLLKRKTKKAADLGSLRGRS
jgi:ATP-dependent helicase/nuclease subunit B